MTTISLCDFHERRSRETIERQQAVVGAPVVSGEESMRLFAVLSAAVFGGTLFVSAASAQEVQ
ncbi:MAG TPA: hypothetical protein VK577_25465, partial [Bradyrhizobium sp.]|nr:hypothetical protein [Bradyrhizobium sp.]